MIKEQQLFKKVDLLGEGTHDRIDVMLVSEQIDFENEATYRVYHHSGYCFEVERQQHCEPSEIEDYDIYNLQEDGASYHFEDKSIEFDGFNGCDIHTANILNLS